MTLACLWTRQRADSVLSGNNGYSDVHTQRLLMRLKLRHSLQDTAAARKCNVISGNTTLEDSASSVAELLIP